MRRWTGALVVVAFAGCEWLAPTDYPSLDAGKGGGGKGGAGGTSSSGSTGSSSTALECFVPVDCPGEDADCIVRVCDKGACGTALLPLGTPTKNQVAGDCQRAVCDGKGQEILIIDSDDLPADADPCTDDVCTASIPSNPPSGAGRPCDIAGGSVCDGLGACVECVAAVDCPGGLVCADNACM